MVKNIGMFLIVVFGIIFMGMAMNSLVTHIINWKWPDAANTVLICAGMMLQGHMLVAMAGSRSG